MKKLTLNNGVEIPALGFGVFQMSDLAECERAVRDAIEVGYRLIDIAASYLNEEAVGRALKNSGIPREHLFVTTKLWNDDQGHGNALSAFEHSIERLDLEYVDLYLIHWPMPEQDRYVDTWKAMIRLRVEGRIRSIGVSNFSEQQIERLAAETGETPAVNQIELHVGLDQAALRAFHRERGIVTESYSPLKHGTALQQDPVVQRIAAAHHVAWNQVVLRWNLQLGTVVIPRSKDAGRRASNLGVTGFELTDDEMAAIGALRP